MTKRYSGSAFDRESTMYQLKAHTVLVLLLALTLFSGCSHSDKDSQSILKPSDSYPDASTTGVPEGTLLTSTGNITVTSPNTIIEGYEVHGTIMIRASNVTIRNTRVLGSSYGSITIEEGFSNILVEDSQINGAALSEGIEGSHGIWGSAVVKRCDISGVENGITPGSGSVLVDNYIHDLKAPGDDPHYDAIQIDGNISDIRIEHNTMLGVPKQTSAVMIDNYFGAVSNIIVTNNYLAGGGYTVYADGRFGGGDITGVKFSYNHMEKGEFGYASIDNCTVSDIENVDAITGEAIELQEIY